VTDYCTGDAPPSPGFQAYITQRGYKLVTLAAYSDYIRDAGFDNVIAEDRTAQVQHILASYSRSLQNFVHPPALAVQLHKVNAEVVCLTRIAH